MLRMLSNLLNPRVKAGVQKRKTRLQVEMLEGRLLMTASLLSNVTLDYVAPTPTNDLMSNVTLDIVTPLPTVFPAGTGTEFDQQWALHNTGQDIDGNPGGRVDADIDAPQAWVFTTGSSRTIVSVLDSGIDYTHPDLYRNIWLNQSEIPSDIRSQIIDSDADQVISFYDLNDPINLARNLITDGNANGYIDGGDLIRSRAQGGWADGIDQGSNLKVDDLIGWDFRNNDNNPMDDNGHGTAVAGIIGADGTNALGIAGINWRVRLMALKISNSNGNGEVDDSIRALNYAVAHGADVTNYSNSYEPSDWDQFDLENNGFLPDHLRGPSFRFRDAIEDAGNQGHIFVASAGNDGRNNDNVHTYPANFSLDNVISVAASDFNDELFVGAGWSSNYGDHSVHLAAPGNRILTTNPTMAINDYGYWGGTSFAAPQVAGVLALVRDQHPDWSHHQVIRQVVGTVDEIAALDGKVISGGRLNALHAVAPGPWIVDSTPLVTSTPYGTPMAAPCTINGMRVTFNESVQPGSFSAEDVAVTFDSIVPSAPWMPAASANVSLLGVQVVAGSDNRRFDILFVPIETREGDLTGVGTYTVRVGPGIANPAGQFMNQDRDSYTFEAEGDRYTTSFRIEYSEPGTTVSNFVDEVGKTLIVDIVIPPPVVIQVPPLIVTAPALLPAMTLASPQLATSVRRTTTTRAAGTTEVPRATMAAIDSELAALERALALSNTDKMGLTPTTLQTLASLPAAMAISRGARR